MEMVIFIGVQASGKSAFYQSRFFATHMRISLDMLRTRRREHMLIAACLDALQPLVIDNTNPRRIDRAAYIAAAKAARFAVHGYYFQSNVADCIARNAGRVGRARVSVKAIYATHRRLEIPSFNEGFDTLHVVTPEPDGTSTVDSDAFMPQQNRAM